MEKKFSGSKAAAFFKKNGYYIIMAVCIVAIITLIGVAAFSQANKEPIDPNPGIDNPVGNPDDGQDVEKPDPIDPILFCAPVANGTTQMQYSMDALVFHKSLDNWQVHKGTDFVTVGRENVGVIADGVVENVENNILDGQFVTVKHAEGYTSVYKSLADVTVTIGQVIKRGDKIGLTSDSAFVEVLEGNHVHLEVMRHGELIDPASVIPMGDK